MADNNSISISRTRRRYYHILLLLIIVLSAGIRLSAINRTIRLDEARNLQQFAQRKPLEFLFDITDTNNHFLNTLLMHIQYRLLGNSEDWKIRVHVFIVGIMVTIATYYVGKELYDADVGIMASALSSVMYLLVEFSINARGYILIVLIYLLMVGLINRMKTQADRRGWFLIGILSALGFFISPVFLYTMGTLGLWMFLSILVENKGEKRRKIFAYFTLSMILGGILTGAYYAVVFSKTYSSTTALNSSYVAKLTQPVKYRDFFTELFPKAIESLLELTHTGMTFPIIVLCIVGLFISIIFHFKLSKNRIPLIITSFVWLGLQVSIQQTFILARIVTFLMPIYAMLIAAGLISLVQYLTQNRIARVYISIVFSLIMCLSITYQLVTKQILIESTETGYVKESKEVAMALQELLVPDDFLISSFLYSNIIDYYLWRDNFDINADSFHLLSQDYFDQWKSGGTRYVIVENEFDFTYVLDYLNIAAPENQFILDYESELADDFYLYTLTVPANLLSISSTDQIARDWFVGQKGISTSIDDNQVLSFEMDGDNWKLFRYRLGKYWRDYQLSFRVKINEASVDYEDLLIRFRDFDESSYSLGLNASKEGYEQPFGFRADFNGEFVGYISIGTTSLKLNQWYDITIDVVGDTFVAYIDGEEVLQANEQQLERGSIGFLAPPDAKVQITNIQIE